MRMFATAFLITVAGSSVAQAQGTNIIVEAMVRSGLSQPEAQARYDLDLQARALQQRLRRDEPSFAGMYGDASNGTMRIFVRLTGDAKGTLAKYTSNPSFLSRFRRGLRSRLLSGARKRFSASYLRGV